MIRFYNKESSYNSGKKLSLCITHMNRFEYLSKTLPINLQDNLDFADKIEFVLVDFDNSEHIRSWIWNSFKDAIQSGYLSFYQTQSLKKWSAPIAKNTAHLLGKGAILTNLDCDNFVGKNGVSEVIQVFESAKNEVFLWQFTGIKRDGTYGRMSVSKTVFQRLGGYNQKFFEMGYQDDDLMNRAVFIGLKRIWKKGDGLTSAIKNKKYRPTYMPYRLMDTINMIHSWVNIMTGRRIANNGKLVLLPGIMQMDSNGIMVPYQNALS